MLLVLSSQFSSSAVMYNYYQVYQWAVVLVSLGCAAFTQCARLSYWQVTNPEALLLPREIVARGLLDVLREFSDNENDFISVMETVARMSEDGGRLILLVCI
jgi:hypothetical protein